MAFGVPAETQMIDAIDLTPTARLITGVTMRRCTTYSKRSLADVLV